MYRLYAQLIGWILKPVWVSNQEEESKGEFGVRIFGVNFYYYKWEFPTPYIERHQWRVARKREFGETIRSFK